MSGPLEKLLWGLATAFILPIVGFIIGVLFSKIIGGWENPNIRKWWKTFCLTLPFVFLGMMVRRMAEDHFDGLGFLWTTRRLLLVALGTLVSIASAAVVVVVVRLWRLSQS